MFRSLLILIIIIVMPHQRGKKSSRSSKNRYGCNFRYRKKGDIHPSNKHDVGFRLARYALKNDYKIDLIDSGPLY